MVPLLSPGTAVRRAVRGGVGIALLFCLFSQTGIARPADPGAGVPDSLTAASIAFSLRYAPPPATAAPKDRWLGRDKAKHVVFSALWTLSTQYVLVHKTDWSNSDALPAAVTSGAVIGIAKEVYDATRPNREASARDLAADAVGIGAAALVIAL